MFLFQVSKLSTPNILFLFQVSKLKHYLPWGYQPNTNEINLNFLNKFDQYWHKYLPKCDTL